MASRFSSSRAPLAAGVFSLFGLAFGACGGDPQVTMDSGSDENQADSGKDTGTDADSDTGFSDLDGGGAGGADGNGSGNGPVCESGSSKAELQPIYLAFAFDVSGSMGQMDKPHWWYDKTKKWDPVVAATTSFFEDTSSEGIHASMVLFPSASDKCVASSYSDPDVPMQTLPSDDFATSLSGYMSDSSDTWRGNTPTRYALDGAAAYLQTVRDGNGTLEAKYAVVLVTDGEPSGCTGNAISDSQTVVADLLSAQGIPTYVIGVLSPTTKPAPSDPLPTEWGGAQWDHWGCNSNGTTNANGDYPCNASNALTGLNDIAASGGTDQAVLIDTNDTAAAKETLRAAIDAIRAKQLSCNVGIPPNPQGGTFNKDRINVSVTIAGTKTDYAYDPNCTKDGAWHYDDAANPTEIEICPTTCDAIQKTPGAQLNVDFLCKDRPDVPK